MTTPFVKYDASALGTGVVGIRRERADNDVEGEHPKLSPSADEPLRGLKHLPKVAVLGREAILALAAQAAHYAWQDIVVTGTIVVIAGGPGEGKTTLLFLILVARATRGGPVKLLSRFIAPAPPGQWIVLIEGEHSESSTARKLLKSIRLLDIGDDALDRIIIIARKQVLIGSPEWNEVVLLVSLGLVADIAIDTIARVAPADANDEREQVQIFAAAAAAIERAPGMVKPSVWAIAHTKKSGTGDLSDVSGSTQRVGQADTVLLVKGTKVDGRTASSRVTFAKLREDPDEYPLPVDFAIDRDARGQPQLRQDGFARDERPLTARIVEALEAGALKKADLAHKLNRSFGDVDAAITELFTHKRIRTGAPVLVRGKPCKTFELAEISTDVSTDEGF